MPTTITLLLVTAILVALFGVVAGIATVSHRDGTLRLHAGRFRIAAPMAGRSLVHETHDADARRMQHDLGAIRTRFEQHPVWPSSGALGERR